MKITNICLSGLVALLVLGAIFLAYKDKAGWGWLIFVALCVSSQIEYPDTKKSKK